MSYKMISIEIVKSSKFTRMSKDAQLIYFCLLTCTDGIGVIDNTDFLSRVYDGFDDSIQELINNGYVYKYDDYRYIIMDWPIHNKISKASYLISKTIHEDILSILVIETKKRYRFRAESECDNTTTSTANDCKKKPATDIDYEQKCNLLREHSIAPQSKRGIEILKKCNLAEIKRGIDYALNHMPSDIKSNTGYIINCILSKSADKKVCPRCKGGGKINNYIDTKRADGSPVVYLSVSDCPICKGVGYIIDDFDTNQNKRKDEGW